MTRTELQDEIVALGHRAGDSGHNFIAACLMFLASAIRDGTEHEVAGLLQARFLAQEAAKRN